MVILDCLYWAHHTGENESTEMKELMRQLVELREKRGIVNLVAHHTKIGTRSVAMHNVRWRGTNASLL
jgi:hypothetical protein